MENLAVKNLVNAVSEFLDNRQESRYRPMDILSLSINCISHKKESISQFKVILSKKFEEELDIIQKRLDVYKNLTFNIDSTSDFVNMISQVYQSSENPAVNLVDDAVCLHGTCLLSIKSVKAFRNIIESNIKEMKLLSNCLLPLTDKVYFLDQKIDYFEYIFKKMLFKVLKRNLEAVKLLFKYCLLICKRVSDVPLIEPFLDDLKYLFNILKKFGIKKNILKSSKPLLIEQDISLLSSNRNDFNMVSNYFESQKCVFSVKFAKRIEKGVLYTLYSDMSDALIAKNLKCLDRCRSIYSIFQKAGLKSKLMNAFSLLLPQRLSAKLFTSLVDLFKLIEDILENFNDKSFEDCYLTYFVHILESLPNCAEIADYVDDVMKSNISNVVNDKVSDLIIDITGKSGNPETFLAELQKRLAIRLLGYRRGIINSTSPTNIAQAFIERELVFLRKFKKMHSENMTKMIGDVQAFINQKSANAHSFLLMTMCKWPMFKIEDVNISPDCPISKYKSDVFDMLKADRKTVSWVDTLSTVSISIFDKVITLSLFQYSIILKLIENGSKIDSAVYDQIFNMKPKFCTYYLKEGDFFVSKTYKPQIDYLLDDLIVMQNDLYILNPFFTKLNYTGFEPEFQSPISIENDDASYNHQAYNEARIARLLKRHKSSSLTDLLSNIDDVTEDDLRKALARLQEKEVVEVVGQNVKYCP
ncbi:uncharacterized protein VICG_01018 [Vittaforma corneae ATCC 50505]|uniref:Cullin family profile domain-containing protein n=1 Tax=Vittaforma corneae (strain ATCC 50505) TaxID=993615 RepID=L2GMC9_VITCO|nr:uncharacterized protein VICG_01018 [Vittaforma corneae ATCC 50505]ELA42001.1 hypothetical protein VICG_01018 [Vittaforma corneae ATCC 50505]